jgi:hypothetical protein
MGDQRERGKVQCVDELAEVSLQQFKAILVCVDAAAVATLIECDASPIRSKCLNYLKPIRGASTERVE